MNEKLKQIDNAQLNLLYNIADIILDSNIKHNKGQKKVNKIYKKINDLKYIKNRISRKLKTMSVNSEEFEEFDCYVVNN